MGSVYSGCDLFLRFLCLTLALIISQPLFSAESSSSDHSWESWKPVGSSSLWWGLWHIYDARLFTPDGQYNENQWFESSVALVIDYKRNIKKKSLLSATDDQWRHLNYSKAFRRHWLAILSPFWPDIKKGDQLVFVIEDEKGKFYFGHQFIGQVDDPALSRAFLEIWLSENTAYPKLRKGLIGLAADD
ncbi:chalcone isomerase family protein [uncultured Endozoicomonas sp.]|uniref:chalcone isomerase family protein n=1 Tax=uncultured Endozoicomonas sp. TaxID=432652 RepID=UPI002605807A|nr:chalcone isomerase family protein [uncultured Endozoicomonas sp.]